MANFTPKEIKFLRNLNTPAKLQSFLNNIPFNFEEGGDTIRSPLRVLRDRRAHCLEGAIFAAYVFSLSGRRPLVLHLKTTKDDLDHCIAPYQEGGLWGAVSKTNHNILRFREPVYRDVRELVMSYFHEYFLPNGKKTLRSYSLPLDLRRIKVSWPEYEEDLWAIDSALDKIKHIPILPRGLEGKLRKADKIEITGTEKEEHKRRSRRSK